MRIAFVFSSPTPGTNEFENIWKKCPQKQEIEPYKLVIEGTDWKLFVFDGMDYRYFKGAWNFETLKQEIANITKRYGYPSVAILLHGTDRELNTLIENLELLDASRICYKWDYTSSKGTFYKKYVMPFSTYRSDVAFENMWAKLKKGIPEKTQNEDLSGEIRFLKHLFLNISIFMNSKMNKAKEEEDTRILLEFNTFYARIRESLDRYGKIEATLPKLGIKGISRVRGMMEELMIMIQNIGKEKDSFSEALDLTNQCLKRAELIHNIFLEVSETTNDR